MPVSDPPSLFYNIILRQTSYYFYQILFLRPGYLNPACTQVAEGSIGDPLRGCLLFSVKWEKEFIFCHFSRAAVRMKRDDLY